MVSLAGTERHHHLKKFARWKSRARSVAWGTWKFRRGDSGMSIRGRWAILLLCFAVPLRGEGPPTGFQEEKRIRQATRLDWEFVAGKPAKLPPAYDPRRVRYQLFVPTTYKSAKD